MSNELFREYKNYAYWMKHSHQYNILDVLEFCGSDHYIEEAALSLPQFDKLRLEFGETSNREVVHQAFVKHFHSLPQKYKTAILRNCNLPTAFFEQIERDIDWKIFVENQGVDIAFFRKHMAHIKIFFCASSDVRKDIFDHFGKDAVSAKLNIVQKLRSPFFCKEELWELGPLCRTAEEKNTYVDKVIVEKWSHDAPGWMNGNDYLFWYHAYNMRPRLVTRICDNMQFLQHNVRIFDWSEMCLNPNVTPGFLQQRFSDINPNNLLKSVRSESLVNHFKHLYEADDADHRKLMLFDWYIALKFADHPTPKEYHYYGNRRIYNPVTKPIPVVVIDDIEI